MEEILKSLTENHFDEEFKYYEFIDSRHGTEPCSIKVADLFDNVSWEKYILLLFRIQQIGKENDPAVFGDFWDHFLVDENFTVKNGKNQVQGGSLLRYDAYLKWLITLVTGSESITRELEVDNAPMKTVVDKCRSIKLFGKSKLLQDIIETVRCYRNGNAHFPVSLQSDEVIPESQKLYLVFKGKTIYDSNLLYEVVRLMLVGLLLVIKENFEVLDSRVPKLQDHAAEVLSFDDKLYVQKYFDHLSKQTRTYLETNAIHMLSRASESGYLEHHLRIKYSNRSNQVGDSTETETHDDGVEGNKPQVITLSQFYSRDLFKTNVVLGMPGAGKSTAFYLLLNDIIRQYNNTSADDQDSFVFPIFIALKDLNTGVEDPVGKAVVQAIVGFLGIETEQYKDDALNFVEGLRNEGRVVYFLDGLNEIPQAGRKDAINCIKMMVDALPDQDDPQSNPNIRIQKNARVFISGREYEYEKDDPLNDLAGSLGVWRLEEFSFKQVEEYLTDSVKAAVEEKKLQALFSSPLNILLLLDFINEQPDDIPRNRGEILEAYFNKVFKREGVDRYYATNLLKLIAVEALIGNVSKSLLESSDPRLPERLIEKLASLNIVRIIPESVDHPEEVIFTLDTYREYFRARYVVDTMRQDSTHSIETVSYRGSVIVNPSDNDDFETLKLIIEIGNSASTNSGRDGFRHSARMALSFIHQTDNTLVSPKRVFNESYVSPMHIGDRLKILCKLVSNVEGSNGMGGVNARDIASSFVLNHLKLFRIQHPTPLALIRGSEEFKYIESLVSCASYVSDSAMLDELFSSYWLFTFGALIPEDFDQNFKVFKQSYLFISTFVSNCSNYCELYDRLHAIQISYIQKKKESIATSIGIIINHYLLRQISENAQKLLLNHLEEKKASIASKEKTDNLLLADINSLLCYIGDGSLLSAHLNYGIPSKLRIKEIHYLLHNYHYTDVAIQQTVFTRKFFNQIETDTLKAFVIRYYLFRVGLTPFLKRFLFDEGFIEDPVFQAEARNTITDLIPLKLIPPSYALKRYDRDIYSLLIASNEGFLMDSTLNYHVMSRADNRIRIVVIDIEESTLVGKECLVNSDKFVVVDDSYVDAVRLYCEISSIGDSQVLLPETGFIESDGMEPIPYYAVSPNTLLRFYVYGSIAMEIFALYKLKHELRISGIPCNLHLPELENNPNLVLRRFRTLMLASDGACSLKYSGVVSFKDSINTSLSSDSLMYCPEKFDNLAIDGRIKSSSLSFRLLGRDHDSFWIVTEKVVMPYNLLVGSLVEDSCKQLYTVASVYPFSRSYVELHLSPDHRIQMPDFGYLVCMDADGISFSMPYCHRIPSYDHLSVMIRVIDERAVEGAKNGFQGFSFRYGNTTLYVVGYEVVRPNKKHTLWTIRPTGANTGIMEDGRISLLASGKNSIKEITVSGETRTTISSIKPVFLNYSQTTGDLFLAANITSGIIGSGLGDVNLLKGLFLHAPRHSTLRIMIDKFSDTSVSWAVRCRIRFLSSAVPIAGTIRLDSDSISYVMMERANEFLLWQSKGEQENKAYDTVVKRLSVLPSVEIISLSGNAGEFDIVPGSVNLLAEERYTIIIHSLCTRISDGELAVIKKDDTEYILQTLAPVSNRIIYPSVFTPLFCKHALPFSKHPTKEGIIIIPLPISDFDADGAVLDNQSKWNAVSVEPYGDKHLQVSLSHKKGGIPKLPQKGNVQFYLNSKPVDCWYKDLFNLIDASKPERYHAEICDYLMEEVRRSFMGDEESIVNFFVAKSRASDLVCDRSILLKISQKLHNYHFNVCRIFSTNDGILAYSPLHRNRILSSDSDSKNHDDRAFQGGDLVLIEDDRRMTLIDPDRFPRCSVLGFKEGYVLSIKQKWDKSKRCAQICSQGDGLKYEYSFSPVEGPDALSVGRHVLFFATADFNDPDRLFAEHVYALNQWEAQIEAQLVKKDVQDGMAVLEFMSKNQKGIRIVCRRKKNQRLYDKVASLDEGCICKLIKGQSNHYYLSE